MDFRRSVYRQQGGTTAGLIIGLIIGLLIAVGIAMTIMKTPLPFIDKIGKPSQSGGDLGDPNKSLQVMRANRVILPLTPAPRRPHHRPHHLRRLSSPSAHQPLRQPRRQLHGRMKSPRQVLRRSPLQQAVAASPTIYRRAHFASVRMPRRRRRD
jgi:cell division protein FtsN